MSNLRREKRVAHYIFLTIGLIVLCLLSIYSNGGKCDGVSPDIYSIVFVSDRDGNSEIYKMKYNGSGETRLTYSNDDDYSPKWSPDKKNIVFVRKSMINEYSDIFVMDFDGKNQKNLTKNTQYGVKGIDVSVSCLSWDCKKVADTFKVVNRSTQALGSKSTPVLLQNASAFEPYLTPYAFPIQMFSI
ncbi:MAG: hypothetical protein GTO45_03850 [Candidatus Aminicenantes bacterium]|nr:hypothetical protein [Candidatus Aminicenantes bacterium]NIM77862.1 hypothetical protein [Candidatus Aminicenantes bacterium]NIN17174.1 hypothetical protein [Candidatus Aminicenantes bacterium]NIN41067.1 hypothetical protein [Candidatus Aminicenantes bacterium]NIN83872.1 hypothetical protein [Candidatus Aminicenantes bacterium]